MYLLNFLCEIFIVVLDTGIKGDDMTNVSIPIFTGTSEVNTTITLTIDNKEFITIADETGKGSMPLVHSLNNGAYEYALTANDAAGKSTVANGDIYRYAVDGKLG
ncbi:TPA: hypothetical protein M4K80_002492 [Salmonella enterica]|nr:hypothetical protein [Salmonella enterica]